MTTITTLTAKEIADSRGEPTLEISLSTEHGAGVASVPSGASVGAHEAHELRDEGSRGVSHALAQTNNEIADALRGKKFNQTSLDAFLCELDGTNNKGRLGANAILGISIAFARAEAATQNVPLYAYLGMLDNRTSYALPQPLFNVLNGGKHARHGIDMQECMLAPIGFTTIEERVAVATQCVATLKSLLEERGLGTVMGDEGGFAPSLASNDEALDLLVEAITGAGYTTEQIKISLDIAASSFYKDNAYVLKAGGHAVTVTQEEMLAWYAASAKKYPLISIEDGFAEDDWSGFTALTENLGREFSIVGDDLTVTNVERISTAIEKRAANACIIKPNQVGTITETIAAVQKARSAGWKIFASHRSGETLDTFIADFAVGLSCDYLKAGAPTRPERMAKYTRLIDIERTL